MENDRVRPERRLALEKNCNVSTKSLKNYVGPDFKEGGVGRLDQAEFIDLGTSVQNCGFSVWGGTTNDASGCLLCWLAKICIHLWTALNEIRTSEFLMMV